MNIAFDSACSQSMKAVGFLGPWFVRNLPLPHDTRRYEAQRHMVDLNLRNAIAKESARLMLRGTETDYSSARRRASNWLHRGRIESYNLPSDAEIESEIYAMAQLFTDGSRDLPTAVGQLSQTRERNEPLMDPNAANNGQPADETLPELFSEPIPQVPPFDPEEGYHPDAFAAMRILLQRLAKIKLDSATHPEGDALYHSLQVFALAQKECEYDEELQLAALLHEVGRGIDRRDPVAAAVTALKGMVTERTLFFIESLPEAETYLKTGKVSRSLRRHEDFDQLLLLARCDRSGRVSGAIVPTIDEALEQIENLGQAWE